MSASHPSLPRIAALAAFLLLAVVPAAGAAGHAATTTTAKKATAPLGATGKRCWSELIKDWYDGRIDKTYPVHCYKDALKNLPPDVRTYSDAYDVISRALAAATHGKKHVDDAALIPPPRDGGGGGGGSKGGTTTNGGGPDGSKGGDGGSAAPITRLPGDRGATAVPVPLLILGGLALLLVAAGAAGLVARRVQARRGGPQTP